MIGMRQAERILWITMILALPALVGCRIPKLRGPDRQPVLPASFNGTTTPDTTAQVGIREFFDDSVLVAYIGQGLAGNQQLKILGEEIRIADNEVLKRRGAYWPFLTFGAGAGLEKPSLFTPLGAVDANLPYLPGQYFPDPLPDFLFGANLSWQVDIWRQLRNARDAASLRLPGHGRRAELRGHQARRRYRGQLLRADGTRSAAGDPRPDHQAAGAEPHIRPGEKGSGPRDRTRRQAVRGGGAEESE